MSRAAKHIARRAEAAAISSAVSAAAACKRPMLDYDILRTPRALLMAAIADADAY